MTAPTSSSAYLEVTQGAMQGQSLPLVAPDIIVGREALCKLPLTAYREVSRRHARFYLQGGTWCVEDLGSSNGTFVNNVRATPSFALSDGAQIQMGDFHARFRYASANVHAAPPGATQMSPPPVAPIPPVSSGAVAPTAINPYPVGYPVEPPKNVALALILSFLWSGLGQLYNGESSKGIAMIIGALISWFFTVFCLIGAPFLLGLWVWGIIDAYQSAERINRASGWQRPY